MWTWLRRRVSGPVGLILLGSLIGQGSVLIVSPVLTRLYSPNDFGAFAVITAVSAVLGSLITLSWDRAVVIPQDDADARQLMLLGTVSAAILSALIAVAAYAWRREAAALFDSSVFVTYWWITPATVFFIGLFVVMSAFLVRERRYKDLAVRNGVQGTAQAASSVILGVAGMTPFGLVSSILVGRVAGLAGMFGPARHAIAKQSGSATLWTTARRYRKFPLISTWSRLLNSLGLQVPVLLIITLYGSLEAGLFALTVRVLAAPVGIVADAVSQYFEGALGHRLRTGAGGLADLVRRVSTNLAAVGAVPMLAVAAAGPWAFATLFGAAWEPAGQVARFMVIAYFAQFVVAPVSRSLLILERQGTLLAWDAFRLGASSLAVVVPHLAGLGFSRAIWALATLHVLCYGVMLFLCLRAAHRKDFEIEAALG